MLFYSFSQYGRLTCAEIDAQQPTHCHAMMMVYICTITRSEAMMSKFKFNPAVQYNM